MIKKLFTGVVVSTSLLVTTLTWFQSSIIYQTRTYDSFGLREYYHQAKIRFRTLAPLREVSYDTPNHGLQRSFLVPRSSNEAATVLWVFFGGNAQLALDWLEFIIKLRQNDHFSTHSFLLFEYPGYGSNPGLVRDDSSHESLMQALQATGHQGPVRFLAHSLGCGVALQFMSKYPQFVESAVLISPFESIADMAVGLLMPWLTGAGTMFPFVEPLINTGNMWNNRKAVEHISLKTKLVVIHGKKDEIVPFEQGERLFGHASRIGLQVKFVPIADGDHNSLMFHFGKEIQQVMKDVS